MTGLATVGHLARRFAGSFSTAPIDDRLARAVLSPAEWSLWHRLAVADRRHSTTVARRLLAGHPESPHAEIAAALLHDIGKVDASIGTFARVAATFAPVGDRARRYRDHERLGAALLRSVGSDPHVVAIVAGTPSAARSRVAAADAV